MPNNPMRIVLLLCTGLAFAACTTASLKDLRRAEMKGTPFQTTLAKLYLEYAESEAAQYDWATSQHFADKGLLAAYGNDVAPERVEDYSVPPEKIGELVQARADLVAYLASPAIQAQPQRSARAQYYFDCWVEQQHEAWQTDDIESCRQGFHESMRNGAPARQQAVSAMPAELIPPASNLTPLAAPVASESASDAASGKSTGIYTVYFDQGLNILPESRKLLDWLTAQLPASCQYAIALNGHTDREGDEQANLDVSQKRVDAVKAQFTARGIPDSCLQGFAFGESDPRVPTADGVPEPANRRVEITVTPQ